MKLLLFLLTVLAILGILLLIMWPRIDPERAEIREEQNLNDLRREKGLATFKLWAARIWWTAVIMAGAAVLAWAGSLGIAGLMSVPAIREGLWIRTHTSHAKHGLYGAPVERTESGVRMLTPPNEPKAQVAAALVNGSQEPPQFRAGGLPRLLSADSDSALPPEPIREVEPDRAVVVDLAHKPHSLIIGESGSGKTNTLYNLIRAYNLALPGAEFMFCSLVQKDWPFMTAGTPDEIARAVISLTEELARRDQLMSSLGAREFSKAGLNPIVFVLDEAEAVFDAFSDRKSAAAFKGLLRNLIRTGRNFGIAGLFGTQLARRDMFDATVIDNMGEVYIHRVSKVVASQFQLWDPAITNELLTMPTGRSLLLKRSVFTVFPRIEVPPVQLSPIYHQTQPGLLKAPSDQLLLDQVPRSTRQGGSGMGPATREYQLVSPGIETENGVISPHTTRGGKPISPGTASHTTRGGKPVSQGTASHTTEGTEAIPGTGGGLEASGAGKGQARKQAATRYVATGPHALPAQIPGTMTAEEFIKTLTPVQRRRILGAYRAHQSYRKAQSVLWPGLKPGGDKFNIVKAVVAADNARWNEGGGSEGTVREEGQHDNLD